MASSSRGFLPVGWERALPGRVPQAQSGGHATTRSGLRNGSADAQCRARVLMNGGSARHPSFRWPWRLRKLQEMLRAYETILEMVQ